MTVSPFEPIFNFVSALFGVDPNVTPNPNNFIQVALYAIFTRIQTFVDPAPPAGTPIVGAADPNSGTVTGAAVFADDPSGDVFFTAPAISSGGGTVSIIKATGAFTYMPTAAQRLAATVSSTDTFTVTARDGLLTSTETVTVPVDAGTPVARIPTTTDPAPQPGTGIVTGNAVFTDPAGRTLTYSGPTGGTSAGGGAVTVDATTGEYTFTPTPAQRFQSTINTDIFTVTASNGVHTTTETVTVPVKNFSQANYQTYEYTVYNLSSQPLRYTGVSVNKDGNSMDAQPAVGSILQPGASQQFSLVYYFKGTSSANVDYENTVDGSLRRVGFTLEDGIFDLFPSTTCLSGGCSAGFPAPRRYVAYFVDPAGTTVTVPATDPIGQAQVLQNLCNGNSNASCSFKATSPPVNTLGLKHPVGAAVKNASDLVGVSTTITVSDAQAVANSIGVSVRASAKVFELVSLELTGTYQTTVTNTHTFTQAVTVPVPPHSESQIFAEQPVVSVTGDFTIVMGNTTFTVQGVTFEYPDPDGQSVYTIASTPITAAAQTPLRQNLGDTVAAGV
jgi:VCBS repeat-containing protein